MHAKNEATPFMTIAAPPAARSNHTHSRMPAKQGCVTAADPEQAGARRNSEIKTNQKTPKTIDKARATQELVTYEKRDKRSALGKGGTKMRFLQRPAPIGLRKVRARPHRRRKQRQNII